MTEGAEAEAGGDRRAAQLPYRLKTSAKRTLRES